MVAEGEQLQYHMEHAKTDAGGQKRGQTRNCKNAFFYIHVMATILLDALASLDLKLSVSE